MTALVVIAAALVGSGVFGAVVANAVKAVAMSWLETRRAEAAKVVPVEVSALADRLRATEEKLAGIELGRLKRL